MPGGDTLYSLWFNKTCFLGLICIKRQNSFSRFWRMNVLHVAEEGMYCLWRSTRKFFGFTVQLTSHASSKPSFCQCPPCSRIWFIMAAYSHAPFDRTDHEILLWICNRNVFFKCGVLELLNVVPEQPEKKKQRLPIASCHSRTDTVSPLGSFCLYLHV